MAPSWELLWHVLEAATVHTLHRAYHSTQGWLCEGGHFSLIFIILFYLLGCPGSWLWYAGPLIFPVACGTLNGRWTLSCSTWDLVPWPETEPGPLPWEFAVFTTGPRGKPLSLPFNHENCEQHVEGSSGSTVSLLWNSTWQFQGRWQGSKQAQLPRTYREWGKARWRVICSAHIMYGKSNKNTQQYYLCPTHAEGCLKMHGKWAWMIYRMLFVVGFFGQSGRSWFQVTQLCLNCFNIFIRRLYPCCCC